MNQVVSYNRHGDVGVITVNNPPVNATSQAVRAGLQSAMQEAVSDDSKAVVIQCAGRTFIAGADITEFGKPPRDPSLPSVLDLIESCPKPVVAAIHGTALGGGLETAMAAHYRIALVSAKMGLPEVNLGLLPGAGGTHRAPRLMGLEAALDLMVNGAPISAMKALECGLIDSVVESDLESAAIAYALDCVAEGAGPRRSNDQPLDMTGIDSAWFDEKRQSIGKKTRGAAAPQRIIDAVELSATTSLEEATARTRELFMELMSGTESKAMRHLFFAERAAAKLPADCAQAAPRTIKKVGIIGGGTMGAGIGMNFLDNGIPVTIVEMTSDAASAARERVARTYETSVQRGRLDAATVEARMGLLSVADDYSALADVDLVVEAVFEDPEVKAEVFRKLDAVCKPGAILATNTSYQDVDAIAAATSRPEDVIGMHYFSPANVMKLLEIVRGAKTAPDVVATAMSLAKKVRKVPVLVGVCYGFVGNRMLLQYGRESQNMLLEGATPAQIDEAMQGFGFAMGPCAVGDLAGLDIGYKARKARADANPSDPRYYRIGDMLAEAGRLGQKTGKGFYNYPAGSRMREVDPEVEAMIMAEGKRLGIPQRSFEAGEIQERLLLALANEGARILSEGIAQRASDIDLVYINGYGFPRKHGGPMFYAENLGMDKVYARICEFREHLGDYWEPAPLLKELAEKGQGFGG